MTPRNAACSGTETLLQATFRIARQIQAELLRDRRNAFGSVRNDDQDQRPQDVNHDGVDQLNAGPLSTSARESTYCFLRLGNLIAARLSGSDVTTPRYGNRRPRRSSCFKRFEADIDPGPAPLLRANLANPRRDG
jgi:hypothetical protein